MIKLSDVKSVSIARRWAFQYTALGDCTRFHVLRLSRRLHHGSSLAFLAELRRAFPFPIKRLLCDHGLECSVAFVLAVEAAGFRHQYIRPRRPLPLCGTGRPGGNLDETQHPKRRLLSRDPRSRGPPWDILPRREERDE